MTYALNFFLLVLPFYKCVLTIYAVLVWAFNTVTLTCALGYTSMLRNNVRSRAWGAGIGCSYRVERCCIVKVAEQFSQF
jgi:hypothetical protein